MKQFALKESTAIRVLAADFTPRKQGKRKVPSVRMLVGLRLIETALDEIWPGLREHLYEPSNETDLAGDVPARPRFDNLKPIRTKDVLTGYKVTFDLGIGRRESQVELDGATLDKFEADLRPGEAAMKFRISCVGISKRTIGELGVLVDCDTALLLDPPVIQDPLTGVEAPPGEQPENTKADVAEDARTRKAGGEARVDKAKRRVATAAKKAAAKKAKG